MYVKIRGAYFLIHIIKRLEMRYFIFIFLFLLISPALSYSYPTCYEDADYPAHIYINDLYENKLIEHENITSLAKDGASCNSHEVIYGVMLQKERIYVPFEKCYDLFVSAIKNDDSLLLQHLQQHINLPYKTVEEYLDMIFKRSPGSYDVDKMILARLNMYILDFYGSWNVKVPNEYLYPVLYIALGGNVILDNKDHYVYKPSDKNQPSGASPLADVYGLPKEEEVPAAWVLRWADIEVENLDNTGAWNRPLRVKY